MSKEHRYLLKIAIEEMKLDWNEFKKEHTYVGGNEGCRLNYFKKCKKRYYPQFNLIQPNHEERCICKTAILEQCYIMNINTGDILVIGNECIKHFEFDTKRYCDCGTALNTSKYQVCKYCRKKQETRLMFMKQEPSINEKEKKETTEEYNKRINNLFIELCKNNKFLY
jgi:hypothetical protein